MSKFFLHSSKASISPALLEVRAVAGWEGYGIAWGILEQIAQGELMTLPMNDLRSFMLESGMNRPQLLAVLKVLEQQGVIAKKEIYDEECGARFFHYYSPVLEEQLKSRELQRIFRLFGPSEKTHRPGIPKAVRERVLSAGLCARCGSTKNLEVDHIVPYSRGGAHEESNFQALCRPCNRTKHNKLEEELSNG